MARTYTWAEALSLISPQISYKVEDGRAAYIANIAQFEIWNKYDWRETLAPLPPFYLIPNEQDFGPPSAIIPANFLGLREANLVNMTVWPATRIEMKPRRDLRETHIQAMPKEISYDPASQRFRVFGRTPSGIGATDWAIDGTYKIRPVKITPSNLQSTLLPWDDQYLQVVVEALKWAAWSVAGDQRAGSVQVQNGVVAYAGQFAVMHAAIDKMASDEGMNLGDPVLAPSDPLVYPNVFYGNYGLLF